ncbi:MAG: TetR/AcrR family transcriptional regulator [Arenimonas sp.]|nr:TetR/AcrR family transcriptional regulator [Arenimonas sp.]MBP8097677.1 TetR/AcrR family transcriptional regulator [Arenimonas sp.]
MNISASCPPTPGRPKDMEKRAAILDAAMELFPSRGYEGVSVDAIAQLAGVSKLTVYSHFTDKESLFGAAVTECCVQLLPHRLFEPDPELPVDEALFQIARAFIDLMMDERAIRLHRVMISQAGQNPRLTKVFFDAGPVTTLREMESFLRQAGAAGNLRIPDPALAAEHFLCLLKGVRHLRVLVGLCDVPTHAERDEHVKDVVRVFLRAFAPEAV